MQAHIALITVLTVALLIAAMVAVGRCRGIYGVKVPATTGHPVFERAFRAQANTNEQVLMFLPLLWLAHHFGFTDWAAWLGYAWLIGRTAFLVGYIREAGKRSFGFLVGILATTGLLILSTIGVVKSFL